jgi:hypothetical protein
MEEILDQTLMEPGVATPDVIEPEFTEPETVVEPEVTYVYIKKYVPGDHFILNKKLDSAYYDNIGDTLEDFENNKFVLLNDEQVEFLNNNPEASMKEVYNMKLDSKAEPTVEDVKNTIKYLITDFDSSNNINVFYINEIPV